ncbi:MAG: hypothetical protein JSW60_06285 [Thermoplasmatales archaeon]|nr:MAG: hypothetical protein JSW60_06285 [Thermoplasmatales archaeon]
MKVKQRYGKIEKKILEILNHYTKLYGYVEVSLRLMAEEITKDNKTGNSRYNTVRNAVNRLEKHKIIQTKVVPVINGWNIENFPGRALSKLRMVRLYDGHKPWECTGGIRFLNGKHLIPTQSNCIVLKCGPSSTFDR